MRTNSKRALHLKILQTSIVIDSWDLAERSFLGDNTSIKYVKHLRDEGHVILTEDVEGKDHCRYRYIAGPEVGRKVKKIIPPIENKKMTPELTPKQIYDEYPEWHPQRVKIFEQYGCLTAWR